MCTTCGCSDTQDVRYTVPGAPELAADEPAHSHDHAHPHEHDHAHPHEHDHAHDHDHAHPHEHGHTTAHDHRHSHDHGDPLPPAADPRAALHAGMHGRTITLEQDILAKNQALAERNRGWFEGREILALNLMSSPGSGKTSLLERTIRALRDEMRIAVVEGDQATTNDAERIRATGCAVIQVNTGTGCHLDAAMLARGLQQLKPAPGSLVLIENVGNLVCPALFDLGEWAKVVIAVGDRGRGQTRKIPAHVPCLPADADQQDRSAAACPFRCRSLHRLRPRGQSRHRGAAGVGRDRPGHRGMVPVATRCVHGSAGDKGICRCVMPQPMLHPQARRGAGSRTHADPRRCMPA